MYIYIYKKLEKEGVDGVQKKTKKKVRQMSRAKASGVIPAKKHRRYCSNSCRRGAAQVYNRKSSEKFRRSKHTTQ